MAEGPPPFFVACPIPRTADRVICALCRGHCGHMARRKSTLTVTLELAQDGSGNGNGCPPEWIMLVPAGRIEAVDGRVFINDAPEAVVEAFARHGLDLPVDVNHRTEVMGPGEDAPAMGWITALEVRDGAIWAHIEWTRRGARAVCEREYRYISPAFLADAKGRVREILSAALVTRPAMRMPALAQRQLHQRETDMDRKELCRRLGLPEDAGEEAVLAAIDELKAGKAGAAAEMTPDPQKFVPRADYEHVQKQLAAAQQALAERARAELEREAEQLVEEGVRAGKIAPATKEFWLDMAAASREGLAKVREFLASAPRIVLPAEAGAAEDGGSDEDAGGRKALTAAEREVAAQLGLSEREFLEAKEAE